MDERLAKGYAQRFLLETRPKEAPADQSGWQRAANRLLGGRTLRPKDFQALGDSLLKRPSPNMLDTQREPMVVHNMPIRRTTPGWIMVRSILPAMSGFEVERDGQKINLYDSDEATVTEQVELLVGTPNEVLSSRRPTGTAVIRHALVRWFERSRPGDQSYRPGDLRYALNEAFRTAALIGASITLHGQKHIGQHTLSIMVPTRDGVFAGPAMPGLMDRQGIGEDGRFDRYGQRQVPLPPDATHLVISLRTFLGTHQLRGEQASLAEGIALWSDRHRDLPRRHPALLSSAWKPEMLSEDAKAALRALLDLIEPTLGKPSPWERNSVRFAKEKLRNAAAGGDAESADKGEGQ